MSPTWNRFSMIMVFYALLSFIVGPVIGYQVLGKNIEGAGNGFIFGAFVSICLWLVVGSKSF